MTNNAFLRTLRLCGVCLLALPIVACEDIDDDGDDSIIDTGDIIDTDIIPTDGNPIDTGDIIDTDIIPTDGNPIDTGDIIDTDIIPTDGNPIDTGDIIDTDVIPTDGNPIDTGDIVDTDIVDEIDLPQEAIDACEDYCDSVLLCDDDADETQCVTECTDVLEDCMEEELDEAITELEGCTSQECTDVAECSWEVGTTCFFGA